MKIWIWHVDGNVGAGLNIFHNSCYKWIKSWRLSTPYLSKFILKETKQIFLPITIMTVSILYYTVRNANSPFLPQTLHWHYLKASALNHFAFKSLQLVLNNLFLGLVGPIWRFNFQRLVPFWFQTLWLICCSLVKNLRCLFTIVW